MSKLTEEQIEAVCDWMVDNENRSFRTVGHCVDKFKRDFSEKRTDKDIFMDEYNNYIKVYNCLISEGFSRKNEREQTLEQRLSSIEKRLSEIFPIPIKKVADRIMDDIVKESEEIKAGDIVEAYRKDGEGLLFFVEKIKNGWMKLTIDTQIDRKSSGLNIKKRA